MNDYPPRYLPSATRKPCCVNTRVPSSRTAQRIAQAQEPGETEGNWTAWIQRKKPR